MPFLSIVRDTGARGRVIETRRGRSWREQETVLNGNSKSKKASFRMNYLDSWAVILRFGIWGHDYKICPVGGILSSNTATWVHAQRWRKVGFKLGFIFLCFV